MKSFWKADFPRLGWVQLTRGNLSPVGRRGVQRQGVPALLCDRVLGSHSRASQNGLLLWATLVGEGEWEDELAQSMVTVVYAQPSSQCCCDNKVSSCLFSASLQ